MAHVQKHTKAAAGHMCAHYDRSANNISNEKIDPTKTQFNYNLIQEREISQMDFVSQRCSEVQCLNRKDVNVMCSWIVTEPEGLPDGDRARFFIKACAFLENRYGKDNAISAHVHMDETKPHMHFAFVPVVKDKKGGIEKVSAKECVDKKDLQTFHKDFDEYMTKVFGRDIGILNEATKEGNRSIEELKRGTAQEKLNEITSNARNLASKGRELQESIKLHVNKYNTLQGRINDLDKVFSDKEKNLINTYEEKQNALERKIEGLESELSGLQDKILNTKQVNEIRGKKQLIGDKVKDVTYGEYLSLKATASKVDEVLIREKELDNLKIKLDNYSAKLVKERDEIKRLPMEQQLERAKMHGRINELETAISRLPIQMQEQLFPKKEQLKGLGRGGR